MQACLNGARRPADHPGLPVTAGQLGQAAAAAVTAGAEALHVHPRDHHGDESLALSDIGTAVAAVRAAAPGTPVGVSTGLWIAHRNVELRRRLVSAWAQLQADARPDFASVNVGEPGFEELVDVLEDAGIAVEAGVWSPEDADLLGQRPVHRVLVEIVTGPAVTAVGRANEVIRRLDNVRSTAPRLLHGEEGACWPLVSYAAQLGLPTRMGLEDTLVDEHGARAEDNADLVRRAVAMWRAARRAG
jgi:uncharacterized protein (DUF849 family)